VKNKQFLLVSASVILLVGLFLTGMYLYKSDQEKKLSFIADHNFKEFVPEYAPRLGTSSPKIYLVEFLDPECESCREFYPHVKALLQEFQNDVQLVVRYAPFHPNSRFAIHILEAARKQGKYWEALVVLLRSQPYWGSHHDPKPELIWKYLPESGVDIARIKTDMIDPQVNKMIEKEMASVKTLGVRATPEFFVNGKRLETFGPEPLRQLIIETLENENSQN
jgi:protein-disulfide isomerase